MANERACSPGVSKPLWQEKPKESQQVLYREFSSC